MARSHHLAAAGGVSHPQAPRCARVCYTLLAVLVLTTAAAAEWGGLGGDSTRRGAVPASVSTSNNVSLFQLTVAGTSSGVNKVSPPLSPLLTVTSRNKTWIEQNTMVIAAHNTSVQYVKQVDATPFGSYETNASITAHPALCGSLVLIGDAAGIVHALQAAAPRLLWTAVLPAGVTASSGRVEALACDSSTAFAVFQSGHMMQLRIGACAGATCGAAGQPIFVGEGAQVTYVAPTLWVASPTPNNTVSGYDVGPGNTLVMKSSLALPRGVIEHGPVVDAGSSRLLMTSGPWLYVVNTNTSPSIACTYKAVDVITALPAVEGPRVYLADASGSITALSLSPAADDSCSASTAWKASVPDLFSVDSNATSVVSSIALTGQHTLVYGSVSSIGSLAKENGSSVWQFNTGEWLGYPAVSLDGSAWVVSNSGQLRAVGLSVTTASKWRDTAVRLAFLADSGAKESAGSVSARLCAAAGQLAAMTPATKGTGETAELSSLVQQGCQIQANLLNGLDPAGHRGNYVHACSFKDYQTVLSDIAAVMSDIETAQTRYDLEDFELTSQDMEDMVSSATAQNEAWHGKLDTLNTALAAYSTQIRDIRVSNAKVLATLSTLATAATAAIPGDIAALLQDIQKLQKEELLARIASVFGKIGGAILSSIGGLAGEVGSGAGSKLFTEATSAYDRIKATIQEDKTAVAQLDQEMGDLQKLKQLVQALNQTLSVLANPQDVSDLPKLLPNLGVARMDAATLQRYATSFSQEMAANLTGSEPAVLAAVQQFVYGTETFLNYVKSWFQIAMQRQQIEGEMEASAIHLSAIQSQFRETQQAQVAIAQSRSYLRQQHRRFSQLTVVYAQDMITQYSYWALQPVDPAILAALQASADPTSEDVAKFSLQFDTMRLQTQSNLEAGSIASVQYVVNRTTFPDVYREFEANGTASVVVQPPANLTGVVSEVRMLDVRVIPEYDDASAFQWNVFPTHAGLSIIVNRNGSVVNFTHEPVHFGAGDINSHTNCPNTCSCKMAASAADLFGCQKNYVNYSPYGTWSLQGGLPSQGNLTRIRFQFLVIYHEQVGQTNTQLFAHDDGIQHPVPAEDHCPVGGEECGWIW